MQVLNSNLVGKTLGNYRLEALIGKGGMSAVFLAQQLQLERYVAVKILMPDAMTDNSLYEEFLMRFQREASLIAGLEHPNITPIYDYGKHEGIAYLVMPYLAGGTLRDVLAQRSSLPLQEALISIEQAAVALDYAHAHGIIHRDLKPSNFLLYPDGRLLLADFGIARIMQRNGKASLMTLTNTGTILGTPDYMAPEMIRGGQIDHRTDIYELGIVLFQMLSGTVPFSSDQPFGVLMHHLQQPVPLLHTTNPAVPLAVDAVIQKATAKNREDRYTSAGALTQALKSAMNATAHHSADQRHSAPTVLRSYAPPSDWSAPTQMDRPPIPPIPAVVSVPAVVSAPRPRVSRPASTRTRTRTMHFWSAWITVPFFFVLALGLLLVGISQAWTQQSEQPQGPTPAQHAQGVVAQFYRNIDASKYSNAYTLLKTNSGQAGYCPFVNGYMLTGHDEVTYNGVMKLSDGTFKVAITLVATELFATGTVQTTYSGYEIVDPATWQIKGGRLDETNRVPVVPPATSSNPTQAAQMVVQQFHSDINTGNYPGAYSQWGTEFHNLVKYCSFVEGYSRTRSDTVHIDSATQLTNGTVQVIATFSATEEADGGTTINKIYHERYIVGQEYGLWRIMNGTLI
jgi:serine/threonine protein kinase